MTRIQFPKKSNMLLCIASQLNMKVFHFDAKTAFLNGKIEETIFMRQPPGFEDEQHPRSVCELNKEYMV